MTKLVCRIGKLLILKVGASEHLNIENAKYILVNYDEYVKASSLNEVNILYYSNDYLDVLNNSISFNK